MTSPRRLIQAAAVAAIALGLAACESTRVHPAAPPPPPPPQAQLNPCSNGSHGNPDRSSPLVCVAVADGVATPLIEPVHVFQHNKNNGATQIHWMTATDGASLLVEMKGTTQSCVQGSVHCSHAGNNCVATINPQSTAGDSCEYQVWVEGQTKPTDPIIIIDSCCT